MKPVVRGLHLPTIAAVAALILWHDACAAASLAKVHVYDRTEGHRLTIHQHDGRSYVVGHPRDTYEIVVDNKTASRILAVVSVDGVNVVSGEDASPSQTGYVIDPYGSVHISGWRKSLDKAADFYFSSAADSYAARTGRPWDLGVIGVALFREKNEVPPQALDFNAPGSARAAAPSAPAEAAKSLGTGHGRIEPSPAQYTNFARDTEEPAEVVALYYDSYENLAARGILPEHRIEVARNPNPFPGRFVPDPR